VAEFVHQDPVVAVVEVVSERDAVQDLAGGRRRAVAGNVVVRRGQADVRRVRRHRQDEVVVVEPEFVGADPAGGVRHEPALLHAVAEVVVGG
jgi:hypothetical protein